MSNERFNPQGVIPACLMLFDAGLEIDEPAYRRHLSDLAGVEGISAITVNGHAAEVHALSFEEQRRAIEIARDEVAGRVPLVAGIHQGNTREASRLAKMAAAAGADALLVFPSDVLSLGGQQRRDCARAHVGAIAESTELPLILFQYPMSGGLGYPLDTLLGLCAEFPSIRAVKDWCNDPHLHERHIRELHALDRRGECAFHTQHVAARFAGAGLRRTAFRRRQRNCQPAGCPVPGSAAERSADGTNHCRSHLPDRAGLLLRSFARHAQPYEAGTGAARATRRGACAPTAGKARANRDCTNRPFAVGGQHYRVDRLREYAL